ncbi:enhanced serine sensitivity protein SseB C-terminal domain-containing protein [Luteimonas sp. A501]
MRIAILLFSLLALFGCATSHLGPQKSPEYFVTPSVFYLSEATGEFSDTVKSAVSPTLRSAPDVERAFLVNFEYPDGTEGVCLCLAPGSAESMAIAEKVGEAFGPIAEQGVNLDIMFISEESLHMVERVAKPFYVRP